MVVKSASSQGAPIAKVNDFLAKYVDKDLSKCTNDLLQTVVGTKEEN